jgi:hypothetical protein
VTTRDAANFLIAVFGLLIGRKAGLHVTGGKRVAQR